MAWDGEEASMSFVHSHLVLRSQLSASACLAQLAAAMVDERSWLGLKQIFSRKRYVGTTGNMELRIRVRKRYWNDMLAIVMNVDIEEASPGCVLKASYGLPTGGHIALGVWQMIAMLSWVFAPLAWLVFAGISIAVLLIPIGLSALVAWMYYFGNFMARSDARDLIRFLVVNGQAEVCDE
jgi:hypothetical protein